MDEESKTGIELKVGFSPISFWLFFLPPTIKIDGKPHRKYWGTHFFEVAPGLHTLRISVGYFWVLGLEQSSIDVTVAKNEIVRLNYHCDMPWSPGEWQRG